MEAVHDQFLKLLADKNLTVSKQQLEQFDSYCRELLDWNQRMNLTAITNKEEIFIKHFYDSISLAFFHSMEEIKSVADIGSGAGFPSIPLKIMYPHLEITIVDSLNKRIQFLNHLTESLSLNSVQSLHGRAEDFGRNTKLRDQFDLVTARAVARLSVLNELCLPFVKKGGLFIAMKGSNAEEEINECNYSLKQLKGKIIDVKSFTLPIEQSSRSIIIIEKTSATPTKYPRKAGLPLKSPLVINK